MRSLRPTVDFFRNFSLAQRRETAHTKWPIPPSPPAVALSRCRGDDQQQQRQQLDALPVIRVLITETWHLLPLAALEPSPAHSRVTRDPGGQTEPAPLAHPGNSSRGYMQDTWQSGAEDIPHGFKWMSHS